MNKARELLKRTFEVLSGSAYGEPCLKEEISEYLASEEQEKREPLRDMERPFIRLTDEEIREILGPFAGDPISGYTRKLFDEIQDKLEKVNGHR